MQKASKNLIDHIKILLADTYNVYLKTQSFHWNIVGAEFYALHKLSEAQYEELADAVDEIAERIRTLDSPVEASFDGFSNLTQIKDKKAKTVNDSLDILIEAHEIVIKDLYKVIEISDKEKDVATSDLCIKRVDVHEKDIWMLKSSRK